MTDSISASDAEHSIGTTVAVDDVPPNGGYGWVVCGAMHLINAFTWGILASYGVYLSYYISNDLFEGTSDLDFTFIGGANFAAAMMCAPFVNVLVRKFGTHAPMYFGCLVFAGGFIAASFATKFWHLILSQGIMVGIGTGFTWLPPTPVLPQWFTTRRSLAQGIAAGGSGVGGVIVSMATTPMIESLTLAWSLRITGIVAFIVLTTAVTLIRDRNATIRPRIKALDLEILARYKVLLLVGYSFFSILGYIVLTYSLSAFALSLGLTQDQGGKVVAVLNAGAGIGRPFIGVLSDRFGRMTVACLLTASNTVMTLAVWLPTNSYGLLLFLAFVVGATSGTYWGTIAPLCAEIVDIKDLPSTLSLMWLTVALPSLLSQAIAFSIRQPNSERPFLWPQIYTGLTFLVGSLFLLELRRQKWGLRAREKHR